MSTLRVDKTERGTSAWWLDQLGKRLAERKKRIKRFDEYYSGEQGRRIVGTSNRQLFEQVLGAYCENFCEVVVSAIGERLRVQGFQFPPEMGDNPKRFAREPLANADADAWRIWQDNGLDAHSQIAHTETLIKSMSYVLVSPFENEFVAGRSPLITVEDAYETIVQYRSGSDQRVVGLKRWWDDEAQSYLATLYYPDRIEKWRADGRHTEQSIAMRDAAGEGANWIQRIVKGETWPLPNPLGEVPIVELKNRPRLGHRVSSEIGQILTLQDAINTLAFNELVASDAAAFPQKWATGVEIPADPKNPDKPAPGWDPDMLRILSTVVPDARMGNFQAADLNQWGAAIDRRVRRIAAITSTPYSYFLDHGGQPPSGSSITSSEAGLIGKARDKHVFLGEAWEEVVRLAFKAMGDRRGGVFDAETLWVNPETLTESEHVDALVKLASLGVPDEQLWSDAGYSPGQIARFIKMRAREPKVPLELQVEKKVAGSQTGPAGAGAAGATA